VSGAAYGNTAFMLSLGSRRLKIVLRRLSHGYKERGPAWVWEYEVPMLAFTERARRAFSEKRRRPESPARFPSNSSCRALEQSMCLCNHRQ